MSTRGLEIASESAYSDSDVCTTTPSKTLRRSKSTPIKPSQSLINGTDNVFSLTYVERELDCQICLSPLDSPVLLPCNSHSLCLNCITSLYKHQKKQKDGKRAIFCPSCGILSGMMKVKKVENLKINRELERVLKAYEKEKALWVDEKVQLETQLNLMKKCEAEEKPSKVEDTKKSSKKGLSSNELMQFKRMLEDFESEKLKEAQMMILESLKEREKALATPSKKSLRKGKEKSTDKENDDDSQRTTPSKSGSARKKSTSQKGMWDFIEKSAKPKNSSKALKRENTVSVSSLEKREYSLRSLKRTRTFQS